MFIFDAAESRTTVGTIAKYRWLFGDEAAGGATTDGTTASITHAYKMAGTFTVTLVVLDDKDSASDPVTKMVTVAHGERHRADGDDHRPHLGPAEHDADVRRLELDAGRRHAELRVGLRRRQHGSAGKDKTIVQHAFTTASGFA